MPDDQAFITEALRLRAANPAWGYRKIAALIPGMDRHKVRRAVERKRAKLPAIIPPSGLPALSFYDTARQALARARTLDEVKDIADRGAALREYARRANDRQLMKDAEAVVVHAERRLGQMLATVDLKPGQPRKNGSASEPFSPKPTLAELDIDKKLSARAQKLASISEQAIEARIAARHDERGNHRLMTDILRAGPINGARSIMGSRHEPDDSLDYFPTPPWATRALMERVFPQLGFSDGAAALGMASPRTWKAWEPACGEGHMLSVLEEYFRQADGSDIHNYNGNAVIDFLGAHKLDEMSAYDWIITNPPFGELSTRFVLRALELASLGVAMFFRSQWAVEGIDRYERIFRDRPPTLCAFFVERVNLCKGRWDPDGTTATAYCWLVWVKDRLPLAPFWIPPGCRESLSKPDDRARFAGWSMAEQSEAAE